MTDMTNIAKQEMPEAIQRLNELPALILGDASFRYLTIDGKVKTCTGSADDIDIGIIKDAQIGRVKLVTNIEQEIEDVRSTSDGHFYGYIFLDTQNYGKFVLTCGELPTINTTPNYEEQQIFLAELLDSSSKFFSGGISVRKGYCTADDVSFLEEICK